MMAASIAWPMKRHKSKAKHYQRARSAETGRFVPLAFAKAYPSRTIVERIPREQPSSEV